MELNEEFEVIVHPQGLLDKDNAGYWTEVIKHPACFAEGQTIEEVVENTRKAIRSMLLSENKQRNDETIPSYEIKINLFEAI